MIDKLKEVMRQYNAVYDACLDLLSESNIEDLSISGGSIEDITFRRAESGNEYVDIRIYYDNDGNPHYFEHSFLMENFLKFYKEPSK